MNIKQLLALITLFTAMVIFSSCYEAGITTYGPYPEPGSEEGDEDAEELADDDDDSNSDNVTDDDDTANEDDFGDDDDTSDDDDTTDETVTDDCTFEDFNVVIHQATQNDNDPTHPLFVYQARNSDLTPFDEIQIASFQADPYYGPSTPGTYSLNGNNYSDCALCVLLLESCDEAYSCDTVYFADVGSVQISAMSGANTPFAATLSNVVFREVDIDPNTYVSTPVPGGATWCVDGLTVDVMTNSAN